MIAIDTDYTINPICPHCRYEDKDVREFGDCQSGRVVDCPNCEKEYFLVEHVSVRYSTSTVEDAGPWLNG